MNKTFLGLFMLILMLSASCETKLEPGKYSCKINESDTCPSGWVCQMRGSDGLYRCYPNSAGYCGDLILDSGEMCDGTSFSNFSCSTGWKICGRDCVPYCSVCGNGIIELDSDHKGEECDDGNLEGGDGCSSSCRIERYCPDNDSESCTEYCGDGILNGPEECDADETGTHMASWVSCGDYGFYGGTPNCLSNCKVDVTTCEGFCGDGEVNGTELCDGFDSDGLSCTDFSFDGGSMECNYLCSSKFDCFNYWNREKIGISEHIYQVWGDSDGIIYGVGSDGKIVYFSSGSWETIPSPATSDLTAVWASSMNNLFVAGKDGSFYHFYSGSWTNYPNFLNVNINDIWGISYSFLYIVGDNGHVFKWEAGVVSEVSDVPLSGENIYTVWGNTSSVFFGGEFDSILKYDGSTWQTDPLPVTNVKIVEIWGENENNIFAVGTKDDHLGIIFHYDGNSWAAVDTGLGDLESLTGVWGFEDSVVVLGVDGSIYRLKDGSWKLFPNPQGGTFTSVWGTAFDNLYISGFNGKIIRKLAGWEKLQSFSTSAVKRIQCSNEDEIIAVTEDGKIFSYSGGGWTPETIPANSGLNSVSAVPDADSSGISMFAVGQSGTILKKQDGIWSQMTPPAGAVLSNIYAVTSPRDNLAYAVGEGGLIWKYNGTSWTSLNEDGHLGTTFFKTVWSDGVDVVIGGENSLLLKNGIVFNSFSSGLTNNINTIWGKSASNLFVGCDNGVLLHFNRGAVTSVPNNQSFDIIDIQGDSTDNAYALGRFGELLHYNGSKWTPLTGIPATTYSLCVSDSGKLFIGDELEVWRGSINYPEKLSGLCSSAYPIYCGASIQQNTKFGSAIFDAYTGCDEVSNINPGSENYYIFHSPVNGTISVSLTNLSSNLDLVISGGDIAGACVPLDDCKGYSGQLDTSDENIQLKVTKGELLYFIVDSQNKNSSPYTISVDCQAERPTE